MNCFPGAAQIRQSTQDFRENLEFCPSGYVETSWKSQTCDERNKCLQRILLTAEAEDTPDQALGETHAACT
jgi:hypothetical protein